MPAIGPVGSIFYPLFATVAYAITLPLFAVRSLLKHNPTYQSSTSRLRILCQIFTSVYIYVTVHDSACPCCGPGVSVYGFQLLLLLRLLTVMLTAVCFVAMNMLEKVVCTIHSGLCFLRDAAAGGYPPTRCGPLNTGTTQWWLEHRIKQLSGHASGCGTI